MVLIYAQQFLDFVFDVGDLFERRAIRIIKKFQSDSLFPVVLKSSDYPITPVVIFKLKLCNSVLFFVRITGAKHLGRPQISRRFAEQRERDRVEYGGFSRARIACDKIQPLCSQLVKVKDSRIGIRTERGHR